MPRHAQQQVDTVSFRPNDAETMTKESWWIGLSREEFRQRQRVEEPRLTVSKYGQQRGLVSPEA